MYIFVNMVTFLSLVDIFGSIVLSGVNFGVVDISMG